jgi:hypothetical protein
MLDATSWHLWPIQFLSGYKKLFGLLCSNSMTLFTITVPFLALPRHNQEDIQTSSQVA